MRLGDDDRLWEVRVARHVKPGKGGAYNQLELRCLTADVKKQTRLRAGESVEVVELDDKRYLTFLYMSDPKTMVLMDDGTFVQEEIPLEMLGDQAPFLQDSMGVTIESFQGDPLFVRLKPRTVTLVVEHTGPNERVGKESDSGKLARLENGVTIRVPQHVMTGDTIEVSMKDLTFSGRVEKAKQ